MKQTLLLIVIFFASCGLYAQELVIKGTVKDVQSGEGLPYASISTADNRITTVSNEDGAFILQCPKETASIAISYLSYKTLEVKTTALPKDGIFKLDVESTELDEIVVSNQPINELIEALVDNSKAHIQVPLLLSTYYREIASVNGNYSKYADALIDYNTSRKKKDIESELVVKQSRAARLPGSDEEMDVVASFDVRKSVSRDCNFNAINALLLEGKSYKDYNIVIKASHSAGKDINIIYAEPKPEVQKLLYSGTIAYNPVTNLILDVNFKAADSHKQYSKELNLLIIRYKIEDIVYRSSFKEVDGTYMLYLSSRYGVVHIRNKKKYDDDLMFKTDLIVTNFSSDLSSFDKKEKYREKTLYPRGSKYTEKFWKNNNAIVLTDKEEAIIKSLEDKQ